MVLTLSLNNLNSVYCVSVSSVFTFIRIIQKIALLFSLRKCIG